MRNQEKAHALVSEMTLAEKASLCSGKNFWYLKGIKRLGLPEIMVTDGPHGLRKQLTAADNLGLNTSVPAVCFPTASALACSFDRDLLFQVGSAIGEECRQEDVAVLLGPGVNIKRSPLCGRNFEYYSEDPYLSGHLAGAFINGVQSQNVGVSLKHFAANNQEKRRMTVDVVMDERTFREIYLAGFETAIQQSDPWTLMCSYNRLFGEYASENKRLLTGILRDELGFQNLVMSDWGAVSDRVKGLAAGLDLEMPHVDEINDQHILQAVQDGRLPLDTLNLAAERVTALILRAQERQPFTYDVNAHHTLTRMASAQSAVLLKNDLNLLPGNIHQKAAVIGAFARKPRYQGTGSSKLTPVKIDNAYDEFIARGLVFEYAEGYREESDEPDERLIAEACRVSAGKDIIYLFAGLPDRYEAESFDRENLLMPASHVRLIEAVSQVNANVVVVLHGGAPVEMNWADEVQAILLMYLGGEAVGSATVDLLLGKTNPAGKLAESWPCKDEDVPSFAYFPGYPSTVEYREGLFVGYRYYDTAEKPVRYPFGYGLSYTSFEYSGMELSARQMGDQESLEVSCTITNTGSRAGSEIVQIYVSALHPGVFRPVQELKGFGKVLLDPGEAKQVSFKLSKRAFAFYNTAINDWSVETGDYAILIGASSRDIRLRDTIRFESEVEVRIPDYRSIAPGYYDLSGGLNVSDEEFTALLGRLIPARERNPQAEYTINSTITDIQGHWFGRILLVLINHQLEKMGKENADLKLMAEKMLMDMPLRSLSMNGGGQITGAMVEAIVDVVNGRVFKGLRKFLKKTK